MLNVVAFDDRSQKHPSDTNLPQWLPKHEFLMLIVAPAGSGKTTLLLNIILRIYNQYWQRILIFSPTIHNDAKWEHVKKANDVLMPSAHQDSRGSKDSKNEEKEVNSKDKTVSFKEPEDDENWCLNNEIDDIMHLKENQIIDPFDSSNKDTKKRRRIGLSKEWYEKAIGMGDMSYNENIEDNVYSNEKKIQRDTLLKKNQRMNRLSAVLVKPPVPEMHKQLKDMSKCVFKDAATENRKKKREKNDAYEKDKTQMKKKSIMIKNKVDKHSGKGNEQRKIHEDDLFEEYAEDTLTNAMNEIDEQVKDAKEDNKDLVESVDRTLWVFDDMVGSGLFTNKRNNAFKRLTVRRRHYYSSLIGVTQAYKEIPKTTRTNANALVLFRIDSDEELQVIYREYPMGLKWKDWLKIVDYCTKEPYTFALFNLQTSDINYRIIRNFDEPLTIEKQTAIIGHNPRGDSYDGFEEEYE